MEKRNIIRPLIIVICIYLIVTTMQGTVELLRSGDKLTRRERELAELLAERKDLEARAKQADSREYLERAAYDKLGLSLPGEEVIIIPKELLADNSKPVVKNDVPNWKRWISLFL